MWNTDERNVPNEQWRFDEDKSELIHVRTNTKGKTREHIELFEMMQSPQTASLSLKTFTLAPLTAYKGPFSLKTMESSLFSRMNHEIPPDWNQYEKLWAIWIFKKKSAVGSMHYITSQEVSPGAVQTHIFVFMVCCTALSVCQHISLHQDSLENKTVASVCGYEIQ